MKTFEHLTPEILETIVGKTIEWNAPIYEHNRGFYGRGLDGGIAKITQVNISERCPILACEVIEGTSPKYIFNEWMNVDAYRMTAPLCFSDGDRWVSFKIVE